MKTFPLQLISTLRRSKLNVDYVFWFPGLLFLIWINLRFLTLIEATTPIEEASTLLSGTLHSVLIVLGLITLEAVLQKGRLRVGIAIADLIGILLLVACYLDTIVFKALAVHLTKAIRFISDSGWMQVLLVLQSSGILENRHFRLLPLLLGMLLLLGIALRFWTRRLSSTLPLQLPALGALLVGTLALGAIMMDQFIWKTFGRTDIWVVRHQVMPFDLAFFRPKFYLESLRVRLLPPQSRAGVDAALSRATSSSTNKPNIFIFIVESLRRDAIDANTAPNLSHFESDCLPFRTALSGANLTHLSWYSILNSNFSLYQRMAQDNKDLWGSAPLRALLALGYEIHVFSGSRLDYRDADRVMFGGTHEFVSSIVDARSWQDLDRPEADHPITDLVLNHVEKNSHAGPKVYLIFYESTHHDYYWPADYPAKFEPYAKSWDFSKWNLSADELASIKNRYRNAVHYVDSLFGRIVRNLKASGKYRDSIIVACGDHGEEFLDFGHMTHGTHLNSAQTEVPILIKLSEDLDQARFGRHSEVISHVDILPTLLDYLGVEWKDPVPFNGRSVFREIENLAVVAAGNGGLDPYEFLVTDGNNKAFFQYQSDTVRIALEDQIFLTKVTDRFDHPIRFENGSPKEKELARRRFDPALQRVFSRIDW